MTTLGVISDTHIPDRARSLPPWAIPAFREAGVDAILHTGDVCIPAVLDQLAEVAPVYAVRGNRDIWKLWRLPSTRMLEFEGVKVGLAHGHGNLLDYLLDKVYTLIYGLHPERYLRRAMQELPQAQVIVFGHTHIPVNERIDGRLCFNPGSACCPHKKYPNPSLGLIHIQDGDEVSAEILSFPAPPGE